MESTTRTSRPAPAPGGRGGVEFTEQSARDDRGNSRPVITQRRGGAGHRRRLPTTCPTPTSNQIEDLSPRPASLRDHDPGMKVFDRGDFPHPRSCRFALHRVRPADVGEEIRRATNLCPSPTSSRSSSPSRAPVWCDPSTASAGATSWPGPPRRDHPRRDPRRRRRAARHRPFLSTTTARAAASCRRCGRASPTRWARSSSGYTLAELVARTRDRPPGRVASDAARPTG